MTAQPAKPAAADPMKHMLSPVQFPGRAALSVRQVAEAVGATPHHIRDLCREGTIRGAVNIGEPVNTRRLNYWRIPCSAYDAWLRRKSNIEAYQE